jgi:hypothetical protein
VAPHCSSKSVRTIRLPMKLSGLLWTAAMLISPRTPTLESFFNAGFVLFTIGSTTNILAINAAAAGVFGGDKGLKSSGVAGRELIWVSLGVLMNRLSAALALGTRLAIATKAIVV